MEEINEYSVMGIIKVATVGPESSGKTMLTEFLARHYNTSWAPEFARAYLNELNRDYTREDLYKIASGQITNEDHAIAHANRVVFFDTNLLVIRIWSEVKYGLVDPEILEMHRSRQYDLYLLTFYDVPWAPDPQREHPDSRAELFGIYKKKVDESGAGYQILRGEFNDRAWQAIKSVNGLLSRN